MQYLPNPLFLAVYSGSLDNNFLLKKFCCNQKASIFVPVKKFKKNYHEQS
jgi:hypothetical protein